MRVHHSRLLILLLVLLLLLLLLLMRKLLARGHVWLPLHDMLRQLQLWLLLLLKV